jgi:hypothetical protein
MKKLAVALGLAILLSTPAYSAGCYTAREVEAEQALRIHSELMVIGLTCLKMPQGQQMYLKYQSFTQKNQALLASYETELISYYRHAGYESPEKQLHTLRTNLANQISQHAITMSTSTFCRTYGTRVDKALAMDQQKIRRWAQFSFSGSPTSQPMCASSRIAANRQTIVR